MKYLGYGILTLALLAVIAVGGWVYVMSNVEQPVYKIVESDGDFEVRDYPELTVAEVNRSGDRKAAVNAGFRPLANYIFAKERSGEQISMTAPVTQSRETIAMTAPVTQQPTADGVGDNWTVRFIMPSKYKLDDLPAPASSDVKLQKLPAVRRATVRFSGVATDESIAEQEAKLRAWAEQRKLTIKGPPTYAYYNDPFTPGPFRRNEVMFEIGTN